MDRMNSIISETVLFDNYQFVEIYKCGNYVQNHQSMSFLIYILC